MKKRTLTALASATVLALAMVSCQRVEEASFREERPDVSAQGRTLGQIVISASLDQDELSKTALASGGKVVWQEGDKIKVFNADNPSGVEFTLQKSSAGTVKGKFTGNSVSGFGPFYAVYPASSAVKLDGITLSVTLPAEQGHASGSFGAGASLAVASAPSISSIDFKNVLGAVSIKYSGAKNLRGITLQSASGEALSGSGSITFASGEPVLSMDPSAESSVSLACGGSQDRQFYVMVPPGVFGKGFSVILEDTDGNFMIKSAKASASNVVDRSTILTMPSISYSAQYKGVFLKAEAFGPYSNTGASQGSMDSSRAFDSDSDQLSVASVQGGTRTTRVQNWEDGFAFSLTVPYNISVGGVYDATLDSMREGGRSTDAQKWTVVKKDASAAWLVSGSGQGFIVSLED